MKAILALLPDSTSDGVWKTMREYHEVKQAPGPGGPAYGISLTQPTVNLGNLVVVRSGFLMGFLRIQVALSGFRVGSIWFTWV